MFSVALSFALHNLITAKSYSRERQVQHLEKKCSEDKHRLPLSVIGIYNDSLPMPTSS